MDAKKYVIGFDIGGTKIGIGLATVDGKLLGQARLENKDTSPDDIMPQLADIAAKLVAEAGLQMSDLSCFGVSAPFPADVEKGVLVAPANNPKWRNVPIVDYLREKLGIDGCLENDANCAALAEWFFGAGRGYTDFIYLTMSTGIGGGIVASNHLVQGKLYNAGEVGHVVIEANGRQCNCGMRGCYEAYAGGRAVAQRIQEDLKDQPDHPVVKFAGGRIEDIDMLALDKAFCSGDAYAAQIWDEMAFRNAQGMGMLINIFNPQRIILGTIAWATGDRYVEPIKKYLPQFAWQPNIDACEIVYSELRRDIGYYAGPAAAINYLREKN